MSEKRIFLFVMLGFGLSMTLLGIYLAINPLTASEASVQSVTNSQPAITRSVTVPAQTMWYDTGIDVPGNASVSIEYKSGRWRNARGAAHVDAQGVQYNRKDLLMPGSNIAGLIGKIGFNSMFTIGNVYNGKPGSGRLYLSMNDVPGTFNDNDGQLEVYIQVR